MSAGMIRADWPAPAGVFAATTTRVGGVSDGRWSSLNMAAHVGDRSAAVEENRQRFVSTAGLAQEPVWLNQVHGTEVVRAADGPPQTADAVISDGRPISVLTADCLPVLLCASSGDEMAAIHCGWRSLAGGIVARTVSGMRTRPANLIAWLGPAISQPAFEVGGEVRKAFLDALDGADACFEINDRGRWQADLYGLARGFLKASGVERAFGGGLCTVADSTRFFSYRRDGETGRMATVIARL